jgi:hypothetical protein
MTCVGGGVDSRERLCGLVIHLLLSLELDVNARE